MLRERPSKLLKNFHRIFLTSVLIVTSASSYCRLLSPGRAQILSTASKVEVFVRRVGLNSLLQTGHICGCFASLKQAQQSDFPASPTQLQTAPKGWQLDPQKSHSIMCPCASSLPSGIACRSARHLSPKASKMLPKIKCSRGRSTGSHSIALLEVCAHGEMLYTVGAGDVAERS